MLNTKDLSLMEELQGCGQAIILYALEDVISNRILKLATSKEVVHQKKILEIWSMLIDTFKNVEKFNLNFNLSLFNIVLKM